MKTAAELKRFREEIIRQYGVCTVLNVSNDCTMPNCKNTSDRIAPCELSWIDYWRAMTNNYNEMLNCSCCGKIIHVGEVPKFMSTMYRITNETDDSHKAFGGHIFVDSPKNASYPAGYYITPLCPACNNNSKENLSIKKGSILCKELGVNDDSNEK